MIATPIISIRVKLSGSVTANQCAVTGQFVTMTNLGIVSTVQPIHTQTNNTSAVVIVPNTLSGSISTLKNLQIYNADTANATVTIEQFNNQDSSTRTVCTKTLIPSETLIIDADGNISTLLEGATISHSTLANLTWSGSGHTGNASTVAYFGANSTAQHLTINGSGSVVLTSNAALTNANLTTPILGTPQSGNLTNCNGNATGLTAGNVSYLNLSANTTNISGTLGLSNGGTNSNLTSLTLKLQEVSNISSAYTNTTASIPYDNTKPQSSEGTLILTKTITPKSVNSTLKISTQLWVAANEASRIIGAVFSNVTGADALSSGHTYITATSTEAVFPLPMQAVHTPNTTNPVNISVRVGSPSSKTVSVNGATLGAILGGSLQSSLIISEEMDVI